MIVILSGQLVIEDEQSCSSSHCLATWAVVARLVSQERTYPVVLVQRGPLEAMAEGAEETRQTPWAVFE